MISTKQGKNKIQTIKLNSIKDNKKFEIDAVQVFVQFTNKFNYFNK